MRYQRCDAKGVINDYNFKISRSLVDYFNGFNYC